MFLTKDKWGLIVYSIFVVFAVVLVANFLLATRDVSWIRTVENYLNEETWEPDQELIPFSDWAFFLYKNGSEQYFVSTSRLELISVVNNLMDTVDGHVHTSISEDLLDEILGQNKIMKIVYRFSTKSGLWTPPNSFARNIDYDVLYFVLQDNSGNGLDGTVVVREHSFGADQSNYSVWEIRKPFLW